MDAYKSIITRKSIRKYSSRNIEESTLLDILRAGMQAPSARNNQPWEFVLITDKTILKEMSTYREFWYMLKDAQAAIIVLMNNRHYAAGHPDFCIQDCAAATENLLLAAKSRDIGSVWIGLYPMTEFMEKVRRLLDIPEDIYPFSIVSLGYPDQDETVVSRYDEGRIHFNKY